MHAPLVAARPLVAIATYLAALVPIGLALVAGALLAIMVT
jgi:hypothetical protein